MKTTTFLKIGIILLTFFFSQKLNATHLMGGEITWECLGNGNYVFHLNLYRDCSGEEPQNSYTLDVHNNPTLSTIDVYLDSQEEITPNCNGISFDCGSGSSNATMMYRYSSSQIAIMGVPPPEGYVFTMYDCCRNSSISNLYTTGTDGMMIRAIMYPFQGQDVGTCYDSSPVFNSVPTTILCVGNEFSFNYVASDVDLDSLVYSFAKPLDVNSGNTCSVFVPEAPCVNELPFDQGFSYDSPFPGSSLNPANIPATINSNTGEVSFLSNTIGRSVNVVSVKAYKCGQLVSEIFREIQVIMIDCASTNAVPQVYIDDLYNQGNTFYDTVYAGELVNFEIKFTDDDVEGGTPQTLTLEAEGGQFGGNFINPGNGCDVAPCATLTGGVPLMSTDSVKTTFNWQTSCNHIANVDGCVSESNTYNFVVKASDDFCPAPASNIATISITILKTPLVEATDLTCVTVGPNENSISVQYLQPQDPYGSFHAYNLVYSTDTFQNSDNIMEVDYNANAVSADIGLTSLNGPVQFYTEVLSGCFDDESSGTSDTISTIHLELTNLASNVAQLYWNTPFTEAAQQTINYELYREIIVGGNIIQASTLIANTTELTYIDTVNICEGEAHYTVVGVYGSCNSNSNTVFGEFFDDITPEIPFLDSVSVNMTTGLSELGWQASSSEDIIGYIIYSFNGTVWNPIDTVYGIDSTYYSYFGSQASGMSEFFRVAALDSCDNKSPMGAQHNSIYLSSTKSICDELMSLSWSSYAGWDVQSIQVLVNQDSMGYVEYASLSGEDSLIVLDDLIDSTHYCFVVRFFDGDGRSTTSNELCEEITWLKKPRYHYLSNVNVVTDDEIELFLYTDSASSVANFEVFRRRSDKDYFLFLDSFPHMGNTVYQFTDTYDPFADRFSYYYYILAIDSCGSRVDSTNLSKSIFMYAEPLRNLHNKVNYDSYSSWDGGVSEYRVWRSVNGLYEATPVYVTANDTVQFLDDIESIISGEAEFCYKIEAVEGDGNQFDIQASSYSNEVCMNQYPKVSIPNAFSPNDDGINDAFVISSISIDPNQFTMVIYDREGTMIFETNDMYSGWDGRGASGKPIPIGVYLYELKFMSMKGNETSMWGYITVIR